MQIHALLAAGSAFLFPLSSAATEKGDLPRLRRIFAAAMQIVSIAAAALGVTVFVFAGSILTVWMGAGVASAGTDLLRVLALGYALLALSVVPYQMINGAGYVRENALLAWLSVAVVIVATVILVPRVGLVGLGWAKIANLAPLLVSMAFVQRKVLHRKGWSDIVLPFAPVLVSFVFGALLLAAFGDPGLSGALRLATLGTSSLLVFLILAFCMQRLFGLLFRSTT
jgi:O-antigen/teichoic acid export membrane protein